VEERDDLQKITEPEEYLPHVAEAAAEPMEDHGGHGGMLETVREADHEGRHIVIRTTYEIEVDGKPVTGHMGVSNDGRVHYHPVPNLSFESAVDVVKQVIDTFPDEFPRGDGDGGDGDEDDDGGHHH
jgi:hypothetical protein